MPKCQNLYKNSFTYHCLKEEQILPFNEDVDFIGNVDLFSAICFCYQIEQVDHVFLSMVTYYAEIMYISTNFFHGYYLHAFHFYYG